jgi:hypothetical protein
MTRLILPNSSNGTYLASKSQTLSANNTTAATAIFGLTGTVEVLRLWGIVTTVLGANHTAAAYRLNDQTAQVDITLNTGAVISAFQAGSTIGKRGLAATAVSTQQASAGRYSEQATAGATYYTPFIIVKKSGAATNVEYVYATTDAPTSGVIQHFAEWRPISADGALVAL